MCNLTITTPVAKMDIVVNPHADFFSCLFPALIAAAPIFIDSLMKCLAGGGQACDFKPGDRTRCN